MRKAGPAIRAFSNKTPWLLEASSPWDWRSLFTWQMLLIWPALKWQAKLLTCDKWQVLGMTLWHKRRPSRPCRPHNFPRCLPQRLLGANNRKRLLLLEKGLLWEAVLLLEKCPMQAARLLLREAKCLPQIRDICRLKLPKQKQCGQPLNRLWQAIFRFLNQREP
jgi:hypothetical protein